MHNEKRDKMKKYGYYILGMNVLALGITLNTLSGLGVGAFSTLPHAISRITFLTFGQANIVFYLIFVLLQIIIEKQIKTTFLLEIPFSFIFGFLVDFYQYLIPIFQTNIIMQIILLLLGNTCCALGVFLMILSHLVMTPVDGLVLSISQTFHQKYSLCKNLFDISMITITIVVCLLCGKPIYGIGIGTVFSAFYIGRVIGVCEKYTYKKSEY